MDDETHEADSVVTVSMVEDGDSYEVGDPSSAAVTVEDDEGPATPAAPLTAAFEELSAVHGGERFTFGLSFNEDAEGLSYRTLRDAFEVTGGRVKNASQHTRSSNHGWTI